MDAHSCKDSARDGSEIPLSPVWVRSSAHKKIGYGGNQNTLGDSGMGSFTVLSYWPAVDAAFHISNRLWPRVTSENTENWKPAGSLTLLVTGVSTQNSHFPQILSACPKGKPHSPSTEHSPKANPRANPSPERQSRSTVLWGGLGHVRLPTEQAQRRPQIVKHGSRLLPISNSSLQACWVPQRVTALPFCTQGMFTLSSETLLPGHKDKDEISQEQHSSNFICTPGFSWGKQKPVPEAPSVKRTRDKHTSTGSCWGFRPPLSPVLVNTLMPRVWGTGNAKTMLVFWPLSFPVLQKAENQVLPGWMPHMGIALQENKN